MATLKTASELTEEGLKLELSGKQLQDFVASQQKLAREERAKEREIEKLKLENEERERKRSHELQMAQLRQPRGSQSAEVEQIYLNPVEKPKLPTFKTDDDMANYLVRFERVAQLLGIDKSTYAVRIGSLLSGKAVDVYASLTPEITADYDRLKSALLNAFSKTTDGYRFEFKTAKVTSTETYEQFACQLGRKLDFWLKSAGCTETFESLRNFLIVDQFMSSVSPELRLFIKERNLKSIAEVTSAADCWSSARKSYRPNTDSRQINRKDNLKPPEKDPSPDDGIPHENVSNFRTKKPNISAVICHNCRKRGHYKANCPASARTSDLNVNFCLEDNFDKPYMTSGTVNGFRVSTIMRDTGCSTIIVSSAILPDVDVSNSETKVMRDYLGRENEFPVVRCYISCKYFEGWANAVLAPIKFCSVLIGNVPKVRDYFDSGENTIQTSEAAKQSSSQVNSVETRASKKSKTVHPLVLPEIKPINVTPEQFIEKQRTCVTLEKIRVKVSSGDTDTMRDGSEYSFVKENGFIYRLCVKSSKKQIIGAKTLVVPYDCRELVLQVAHENPLAGHFSHRKTKMKVFVNFYWPGASVDIRNYCRSCDTCQKLSIAGKVKKVPLVNMPIITEPFSRVNIDVVGPMNPASHSGHKYVLTLIDVATGFPEAIPLKNVDTVTVAESLLEIFARVGIPKEILSDNGTQFKSALMDQLHKLLGIKPNFSTVYHPQCCGRVERLHSTLKSCLRKLCQDRPKDWNRYISPVMFALREMPSDRSGFSPFELLYGRQARGPLAVLRDLWENKTVVTDDRNVYQYVLELQTKLKDCAEIAKENSKVSAARYKSYFDVKSQDRRFKVNDEVLVLLPDSKKKLLMSWLGPFKVLECKSRVNYVIDQDGVPKLYHANLLKKYYRRASVNLAYVADENPDYTEAAGGIIDIVQCCCVQDTDESKLQEIVSIPDLLSAEENPVINPELTDEQICDVNNILGEYSDVFSTKPGLTNAVHHHIELTTKESVKSKLYPVPVYLRGHCSEEVTMLREMGIIRPSKSSSCSSIVMVKKGNSDSYRMTIDYRALNAVTKFDCEPTCLIDEDLQDFYGAKYFTELDLTKAYYQIPLTPESCELTAFATPQGLMEFVRMPFGLVTACATYVRLMRMCLKGLQNVSFYFDNILIYADTWEDHVNAVKSVLQRLREFNLTAQPSKCKIGLDSLEYLGYHLSGEDLRPQAPKLRAIQEISPPTSKKQLRSFLGLVSFYRKFVPNLATISAPLTDMLKKNCREPLVFSSEQIESFNSVKRSLTKDPVLRIPDLNSCFVLRTDASNVGVGAVLLQYFDNEPFPISYASRKLSDTEKRYSVIERECLAIMFGISKFKQYLIGKEFILEVDHRPLVYLNKFKGSNDRLMRWALSLQSYKFRIVYIRGAENVGADCLSRNPVG